MPVSKKSKSNYDGWLLKIGNYIIPTDRFIRADSYKASAYMQDVDPWTDADGYLHRNAVKLKALRIDFETPAMLTDSDLSELLWNIDQNITNVDANECYITAFVPRYNKYFPPQKGYMADIDPQIYGNYDGKLRYDPIAFSFVGGVYNG